MATEKPISDLLSLYSGAPYIRIDVRKNWLLRDCPPYSMQKPFSRLTLLNCITMKSSMYHVRQFRAILLF